MRNERVRVWTAWTIVSTVWGSTWLAIHLGLEEMPVLLALGLRFALAASVLGVIVRLRRIEIPRTPDAMKVYATLGVVSFTIPFALVYWGQQFIPTGLSSILFAAYPFWVALFSHLFLRAERLNGFKIAGIASGFAGLVIIFSGDLQASHPSALAGMGAILVSTIMQGFSLIVVKRFGQPVSPFAMNFVGMAVASVLILGGSLLFERGLPVVWSPMAVGSVAYLAIVGSVLTFVSYFWLLKRIQAVYLSLTSFVNPIVAVILGAVVLGESFPPAMVAGASMVLGGILIANGNAFRARATRLAERP